MNEELDELFGLPFYFVNCAPNWKVIAKLADYILSSKKYYLL